MNKIHHKILLVSLLLWSIQICYLILVNTADYDLWGRISVPVIFEATGVFPFFDDFSFTAQGHPWFDHEWLSGFFFLWSIRLFGDNGLFLFKISLLLLLYLSWARFHSRRRSHPLALIMVGTLTFQPILQGFAATARAQNFTFAFLGLTFLALDKKKNPTHWMKLAFWLLLGCLWANVHGGFVAGLGLLSIFSLSQFLFKAKDWRYLLWPIFFLVGSLINPYGWQYFKFILMATTMPRPEISEWGSMPLFTLDSLESQILILFMLISSFLFLKKKKTLFMSLFLLLPAMLAMRSMKHMPLAAVAALFWMPLLIRLEPRAYFSKLGSLFLKRKRQFIIALGIVQVPVLAFIFTQPMRVTIPHFGHNTLHSQQLAYPLQACQFLFNSGWSGNVFVPFNFGEFCMYNLYPKFRINLDGRYEEVYTAAIFEKTGYFYDAPLENWGLLEEWDCQFLIWPKTKPNLKTLPSKWNLVYEDPAFVVLSNTQTPPRPYQSKYSFGEEACLSEFILPWEETLNRFSKYGKSLPKQK